MHTLHDKAGPVSFFLVEVVFSGPLELILLGDSNHCTGTVFSFLVSEGLKAELWQMAQSVSPLEGREKFCPMVLRTGPGSWEHAPDQASYREACISHFPWTSLMKEVEEWAKLV